MVNFADCVSMVQHRNLVTNTPTKNGIKELLVNATKTFSRLEQDRVMFSMGAKYKGKKTRLASLYSNYFILGGLPTITDWVEKLKEPIDKKMQIVFMNGFAHNEILNKISSGFKSRFKAMSDEEFFNL